jgi:hypothetical protein
MLFFRNFLVDRIVDVYSFRLVDGFVAVVLILSFEYFEPIPHDFKIELHFLKFGGGFPGISLRVIVCFADAERAINIFFHCYKIITPYDTISKSHIKFITLT